MCAAAFVDKEGDISGSPYLMVSSCGVNFFFYLTWLGINEKLKKLFFFFLSKGSYFFN